MWSAKVRPLHEISNENDLVNDDSKINLAKYVLDTSELFRLLDDQSGENIFVILFQGVIFHSPQRRLGLPYELLVDVLARPRRGVDRKLLLAGRRNGYSIRSKKD